VNLGLPVGTLITNTAIVDSRTGGVTQTTPVTVTVGPTVVWDSSFQVVDKAYVGPDQGLIYTITVSNTGNVPATGVVVTDTLDSHVTFASASAGGVFANGLVVWDGLTVTDGTHITLTLAVTVNNPLIDVTAIVNQVRISDSSGAVFVLPTTIVSIMDQRLYLPVVQRSQ
jgi:uncharacterized repeat protein (TIGR01451 family)